MEQRVLAFLVCIIIVVAYSGCALEAASPRDETVSTTTVAEPEKLRSSHGPIGQKHRAMQPVEEAFRTVESVRKVDRFTLSELKTIAKETRFSPAVVSESDLEVLKIFVASNWVPVVVIRSPVGSKHLRAVVGYDDSTGRLTLTDPVSYAHAELEYSEFSKQWSDAQKTSLLVFWEYTSVDKIRSVLRKYLSEEKVDSIQVRTPRES